MFWNRIRHQSMDDGARKDESEWQMNDLAASPSMLAGDIGKTSWNLWLNSFLISFGDMSLNVRKTDGNLSASRLCGASPALPF